MSNLAVFSFEGHDIRWVDGKPVGNDVALALGYSDPAKTISTKVKPENKGIARVRTAGGFQSVVVLEEAGVLQLVSSSRLPNAIDIAKRMGLVVLNSMPEQDSVRILESAFSDLSPVKQFPVCGYRIDLYLAKANIAIECDESGHSWGYLHDPSREHEIRAVLGCSFVRFNPSRTEFNIGDVIFAVRKLI